MTDLKTLKDIDKHCAWCINGCDEPHSCERNAMVHSDSVKEEAIKWVKELRKSPDFFKGTSDENGDAMIRWIKFFHNITEEGLKGG